MNAKCPSICFVALVATLFGCATTPRSSENHPEAGEVTFYEPAQLNLSQYETVEHLWVGSWRTAVWYPSYSNKEEGVTALKAKAARLGANGLINVTCSEDKGLFSWSAHPPLICFGMAIHVH